MNNAALCYNLQISHYSSYQTKEYHIVNNILSCNTTHAIYLWERTIYDKQYIGLL